MALTAAAPFAAKHMGLLARLETMRLTAYGRPSLLWMAAYFAVCFLAVDFFFGVFLSPDLFAVFISSAAFILWTKLG
jgi:hypothetical protein